MVVFGVHLLGRSSVWHNLSELQMCAAQSALTVRTKLGYSTRQVKLFKHRETTPKWNPLTYLRSFFSGGDFLSQPWKMISPPLMFVSVCWFLSRSNLPSVTRTWRLLKACPFKVLSALGSYWRSLLPPFDKKAVQIKVVLVGDVAGSLLVALCATTSAQEEEEKKKRRNWKLRTASWCGAAG